MREMLIDGGLGEFYKESAYPFTYEVKVLLAFFGRGF